MSSSALVTVRSRFGGYGCGMDHPRPPVRGASDLAGAQPWKTRRRPLPMAAALAIDDTATAGGRPVGHLRRRAPLPVQHTSKAEGGASPSTRPPPRTWNRRTSDKPAATKPECDHLRRRLRPPTPTAKRGNTGTSDIVGRLSIKGQPCTMFLTVDRTRR
jgi:hypothetical protein